MNVATRFTIAASCFLLCLAGIICSSRQSLAKIDNDDNTRGAIDLAGAYQYAAQQNLSFSDIETIIRRDPATKSQHGRIEFGSVKMERGTALVQVLFVEADGRVQPFLFKLVSEKNAWKVASAQRMWFVPRSHLLRGVRV